MMRIIYFILFFIAPVFCMSQNLSQARKTNWAFAGINHVVVPPSSIVNIMSFGADATGVSPNDLALQSALASLNGNAGIILFPAGIFLFNSTISLPDSVTLRGGGSTATTLQFNLNGVGDLIRVAGSAQLTTGILLTNAAKKVHLLNYPMPLVFPQAITFDCINRTTHLSFQVGLIIPLGRF